MLLLHHYRQIYFLFDPFADKSVLRKHEQPGIMHLNSFFDVFDIVFIIEIMKEGPAAYALLLQIGYTGGKQKLSHAGRN